ncbi:uncharacterized protein LOC100905907 [Galendromus occidentalis]|uniref:Uncharacterized protein LOC100905907 n=1 Tax=Galendromus occidentalis TaxID=34638 RepID=A0AAJ6QQM5_9ACAR|nr:uncharacterized protein LOC100905907 [Galendromus occidentalis]
MAIEERDTSRETDGAVALENASASIGTFEYDPKSGLTFQPWFSENEHSLQTFSIKACAILLLCIRAVDDKASVTADEVRLERYETGTSDAEVKYSATKEKPTPTVFAISLREPAKTSQATGLQSFKERAPCATWTSLRCLALTEFGSRCTSIDGDDIMLMGYSMTKFTHNGNTIQDSLPVLMGSELSLFCGRLPIQLGLEVWKVENSQPDTSRLEAISDGFGFTASLATWSGLEMFSKPLDLPPEPFSGDRLLYRQFITHLKWWIESKRNTPAIVRLMALRKYLTGEAKQLIETLELTEDNYEVALDLLETNYARIGSERLRVLKELRALPRVQNADDVTGVRRLLALVQLVAAVDAPLRLYALTLRPAFENALPRRLRNDFRQWRRLQIEIAARAPPPITLPTTETADQLAAGVAGRAAGTDPNIVVEDDESELNKLIEYVRDLVREKEEEGYAEGSADPSRVTRGAADIQDGSSPEEIDLLLANDILHLVYAGQYKKFGKIVASPTIFGGVYWGQDGANAISSSNFTASGVIICSTIATRMRGAKRQRSDEEMENLEFLWDSEFLGVEHPRADDSMQSAEDLIDRFKDSVERLPSGQYSVSLPLKDNLHTLGDNQKLAFSRLIAFLKNARKEPEILRAVDKEIRRYLDSNFIEIAEPRSTSDLAHYLPILAVAKKSAANSSELRVRVVKDCGSRSKDEASLNDVLETGPDLLPDILLPLLQFRSFPIVIVTDIKQAFMNFLIAKHHRTLLRFGDLLGQLKKSFFMDDLCTGASSIGEANIVVTTIIDVLHRGHFPLDKWATNSQHLADFLVDTVGPDREVSASDEASFLGTHCNQRRDHLFIDVTKIIAFFQSEPLTKRHLLRGLAQIYDPLGHICPIAINFKILMQIIWTRKIDWDTELPNDLKERYQESVSNLSFVPFIQVDRNLLRLPRKQATRELHVFADASLRAFGTVAYIREFSRSNPKGEVAVRFIMAKASVTPIKGKWTIPRLELMAALLAARISNKIRKYLDTEIDSVFMYSDSSSVLGWIRDTPSRWTQFVPNRVREIQSLTTPDSWSYTRSEENPSDLLSRASPLDSYESSLLWLQGPSWLASSEGPRPHSLNPIPTQEALREYRRPRPADHVIDAIEFRTSEEALIKHIRRTHFPAELASRCQEIARSSKLYQLNPFVSEDGFVRCRSGLQKATQMSYSEQCPILLVGEDFLVQLLLRSIHEFACLHFGGVASVLKEMRRKFFVIRARRAAKAAVAGCKVCARYRAVRASEPIPPLPSFRLEASAPFECCGTDHAGPVYFNLDTGEVSKGYILLFVCATSRACRLELVPNLSTDEFFLAMSRFIARNPTVQRIVSDNSQTFRKASKKLQAIFDNARVPKVRNFLASRRIEWQCTTPLSPWEGGFFGRVVQMAKRPLRKILGVHTIRYRELEETLFEIEKMINDRPLSAVVLDLDEPRALTPSDLLYGYSSGQLLPETKIVFSRAATASAAVFSERWLRQQSILRQVWKEFKTVYLQYLSTIRSNDPQSSRPLKVGDVCILKTSDPSRGWWPLCVVLELLAGRHSACPQSCLVKTSVGQTLKRPIDLLYRLEVADF